MAEPHEIRIGTAERELAQRLLGEHFAAGRLTLGEFEERSGAIEAATTRGDLVVPFSDLPLTEPAPRRRRGRRRERGFGRGRRIILGVLPLLLLAVFFVADRYDIGLWLPATAAVAAAVGAMVVVRSRPTSEPDTAASLGAAFLAADPVIEPVIEPGSHPSDTVEPHPVPRTAPSSAAILDALTLLPIGLVAAASMVAIRFPVVMMISAIVLVAVVVKAYRIITGRPGHGV